MFPKNYDFFIVNSGIDKRSSMLRSRHRKLSSAATRASARDQKPVSSSGACDALELDSGSSLPDSPMMSSDAAQNTTSDERAKDSIDPREFHDAAVEDLTSTMSTLKFIPTSVRFGRGGRRGGLSRSWNSRSASLSVRENSAALWAGAAWSISR
jgi:hypothetical protein